MTKPGLRTLTIKDKSALYLAYMPFVTNGGLFVPTNSSYKLGDEVSITVEMRDDSIVLGFGNPLTGIHWPDGVPRNDYELQLTATRLDGTDFFCGLTFPVGDGALTLIVGGWGGALVGLSCLDGHDASDNETTRMMRFRKGQPVEVCLRVEASRVTVHLDDALVIDVDTAGRACTVRPEVAASEPLGIASFMTTSKISRPRIRRLR